LLETVRQYGQDRLYASGESATVRRRHQEFFLTLAERAEPGLRGPEQAAWLERLEVEHDNLRAALEWSRESHEAESMLRLTGSLWRFWYVRGYYSEGRGWLEESLRTSSGASPALRAMVLGGAGYLATYQLDYSAALAFLEKSLALRRQLGDRLGIADSLHGLGRVASRQGDFKRAAALFGEALALFTELRTRDGIAMALNSLGLLAGYQGNYATARSLLQESLAIDRELGDRRGIAFAAGNLGVIALRQGDYAAARVLLKESLAIDRELGDKRGSISELEELGLLAAAQGQAERAARLLGAAEALREATSVPPSSSERAFYDYDRHVAVVSAMLGHDHFATAWAHGRAMTLEQSIEYAMREDA
jgi:non-specific serine/threonine protein kinase